MIPPPGGIEAIWRPRPGNLCPIDLPTAQPVRHTQPVAREARFPNARPQRRLRLRRVAVGLAGALAVLLTGPLAGPAGNVPDLAGNAGTGAAVVGQEPTPAGSTVPVVAAPRPSSPAAMPPPVVGPCGYALGLPRRAASASPRAGGHADGRPAAAVCASGFPRAAP